MKVFFFLLVVLLIPTFVVGQNYYQQFNDNDNDNDKCWWVHYGGGGYQLWKLFCYICTEASRDHKGCKDFCSDLEWLDDDCDKNDKVSDCCMALCTNPSDDTDYGYESPCKSLKCHWSQACTLCQKCNTTQRTTAQQTTGRQTTQQQTTQQKTTQQQTTQQQTTQQQTTQQQTTQQQTTQQQTTQQQTTQQQTTQQQTTQQQTTQQQTTQQQTTQQQTTQQQTTAQQTTAQQTTAFQTTAVALPNCTTTLDCPTPSNQVCLTNTCVPIYGSGDPCPGNAVAPTPNNYMMDPTGNLLVSSLPSPCNQTGFLGTDLSPCYGCCYPPGYSAVLETGQSDWGMWNSPADDFKWFWCCFFYDYQDAVAFILETDSAQNLNQPYQRVCQQQYYCQNFNTTFLSSTVDQSSGLGQWLQATFQTTNMYTAICQDIPSFPEDGTHYMTIYNNAVAARDNKVQVIASAVVVPVMILVALGLSLWIFIYRFPKQWNKFKEWAIRTYAHMKQTPNGYVFAE
jgi:TolA-binding protein